MALRLQVVKNLRLIVRLRSGRSNRNAEIKMAIRGSGIFEIEIAIEISVISMILRLPENHEITPTLLESPLNVRPVIRWHLQLGFPVAPGFLCSVLRPRFFLFRLFNLREGMGAAEVTSPPPPSGLYFV